MGGPDGCPVCGDDRGNGISHHEDTKIYVYEKAGRRQQKEGDAS